MPTTIAQGFAELQDNLQITGLQEATVDTRQQNVRDAFVKDLKVLTSFVTGSYRRSTHIAPLSKADIDIFVILDAGYYQADGYANILDRVKRVLKQTYPNTPEISRMDRPSPSPSPISKSMLFRPFTAPGRWISDSRQRDQALTCSSSYP